VARRGHEVAIAAPPEARIFAEAPAYGVEIIGPADRAQGPRRRAAVRRLLADRPFDIVNTHSSTDSWLATLAIALSRRRSPALVRTRHISSPVPATSPGRWLYARADRIVTTGEKLRLQVIEEVGRRPGAHGVDPHGNRPERFQPGTRGGAKQLGLHPDAPILASSRRCAAGRPPASARGLASPRTVRCAPRRGRDGPCARPGAARHRARRCRARDVCRQPARRSALAACPGHLCLPSYANEGVPRRSLRRWRAACGS